MYFTPLREGPNSDMTEKKITATNGMAVKCSSLDDDFAFPYEIG